MQSELASQQYAELLPYAYPEHAGAADPAAAFLEATRVTNQPTHHMIYFDSRIHRKQQLTNNSVDLQS